MTNLDPARPTRCLKCGVEPFMQDQTECIRYRPARWWRREHYLWCCRSCRRFFRHYMPSARAETGGGT